jgi:hypothetical protein
MGRLEARPTFREGPRMTTLLQTDPRRAANPAGKESARDAFRKPGRPPLEMPVLFQLADLSPQHIKPAPPKVLSAAVEPPTLPEIIPPSSPINEAATIAEPPKVEAAKDETAIQEAPAVEAPKLELPQAQQQPELIAPQPAAEPKVEVPLADKKPAAVPAIEPRATDVTPPQEPTAPSPRQRAEQRAKNRQPAPAKHDWMRTQGKYIAVGFVIALIATIYLAQNGDEPAPANPDAAATSHEEAAVKSPSESEPKVTDAHTAKESVSVSENQHSPALRDETNPAMAGKSSTEARADLNVSPSGHVIKEPAQPSEVADSKSLFPWKEDGETRVAAKPAEKVAKPQAEAKSPERNANVQEQPSVYGPPGTGPQEEEVQQATGEMPQGKSPGSYPETNPGTYREFEPPQTRQAPPSQTSSPRATPASYQPGSPNNVPPTRTSGPRYERTGSGLY